MSELGEREPQIPKIQYWFVIRDIPAGGAPEDVKQQWVNIPLPCRRPHAEAPEVHFGTEVGRGFGSVRVIEDGVAIEADDAIKALRLFGRESAATWWETYYGRNGSALVFRAYEGEIIPPDYAERLLPGLEDFDRL